VTDGRDRIRTGSRRSVLVAFSGIMLATLLAALDQTIVATALPRIASDLGAFERLSWVVTAYLLASTITIPLYGKLSDLFGRRRLFLVAIWLFTIGSVLCGVAATLDQLVAARALQGLGAGGLLPLSQAAIGDLFPPRDRARYQGLIGSMWATAALMGPLVGGVLADHATWRWIFLVNVPFAAATLVAVTRTMPAHAPGRRPPIDWAGAVLLTVATLGVLLACTWGGGTYPWLSAPVLAAAGAAVAATIALVGAERRAADPFLPLGLVRARVPRVTVAGSVLVGVLVLAVTIYAPVFVQGALGRSATTAGTLLLPMTLGWVVASFLSGQLVSRTGRYRIFPLAGGCLAVAGALLLARAGAGAGASAIAVPLLLLGAAMGMTWPVYMVATQNAVARSELGAASGGLLFVRTIAGAVGVAVLGAVLNARLGAAMGDGGRLEAIDPEALASALQTVFALLVPVALGLLVAAAALEERPLRSASEADRLTQE
jgi:EmrB/QacA subfamily drug resistance transporter